MRMKSGFGVRGGKSPFASRYVQQSVGLQREAPASMVEHGLHAGLHVALSNFGVVSIARLQKAMKGLDVVVASEVLPTIHHF